MLVLTLPPLQKYSTFLKEKKKKEKTHPKRP